MSDYLLVDATNVLWRTFFAHPKEEDATVAGLAHHSALMTLAKYHREHDPKKGIVMCFDLKGNWRKEYTKSEQCLSGKPYKGNRRQNMTPAEKLRYEQFLSHIQVMEEMFRDHTSIITLSKNGLEADDLVAGFVQAYSEDNEIVIVSSDKDLIQLLGYPNTRLIDPASNKDRTLDEWEGDVGMFLFEKCIRGDRGDNVQSALPRVRKTRIVKAYADEYERANLMETTWTDQNNKEFKVGELFEENKLLMDLSCQPDDIQKDMFTTILRGLDNPGKYSHFHFLGFCGKYELKKITQQAERYAGMLSITHS